VNITRRISRRKFVARGTGPALVSAVVPLGTFRNAEASVINDAERQAIEKELNAAVAGLIEGCEALDFEKGFRLFVKTDEFRMITLDGQLWDFPTYFKANVDYLGGCSSFKLKTIETRVTVLSRELAAYQWIYSAEAAFPSGDLDVIDRAGATFVFRKADDGWKAVCYQESALPPRRESSAGQD
jgi:hypothetical protein